MNEAEREKRRQRLDLFVAKKLTNDEELALLQELIADERRRLGIVPLTEMIEEPSRE